MKNSKSNKAEVNITKTYFDTGQIIFPQKQIDYGLLTDKSCTVRVYLGKIGDEFIDCNIVFTTNNSARINDIRVKFWFEAEKLRIGNKFFLEIIDKTTIRIFR